MRWFIVLLFFPLLSEGQDSMEKMFSTPSSFSVAIAKPATQDIPKQNSTRGKGPHQFGVTIPFQVPVTQDKLQWTLQPNGRSTAAFTITAADAVSINLLFSWVRLDASTSLLCYDKRGVLRGKYQKKHVSHQGRLTTFPIQGDWQKIVLETQNPEQLTFTLKDGVYGFAEAAADAGSCNINANCPLGSSHRNQQKAVGIVLFNGNSGCTGTLVNNSAYDGTPYILTAGHCIAGRYQSIPNWAFAMEFESPGCEDETVVADVYTGMEFLVKEYASDAGLLLMNNTPSPPGGLYYMGWNSDERNPREGFVFHHPSSDIKKVSFDENGSPAKEYPGTNEPYLFWEAVWSQGTTERGSSGSALMDANKLAVGVLTGGDASCNNLQAPDYFGRITDAFEYLPADTFRNYSPYLDPAITKTKQLVGYDPETDRPSFDLAIAGIHIPTVICDTLCQPKITVHNAGTSTVENFQVSIRSRIQNSVVSDTTVNRLDPGNSNLLALPSFVGTDADTLDISVTLSEADARPINNTATLPVTFTYGSNVDLQFTMDNNSSFNSWEIVDSSNSIVGSGGPYEDDIKGYSISRKTCLQPGACYTLRFLDADGNGLESGTGFTLYDAKGKELASGWNRNGSSDTVNEEDFCLDANLSLPENNNGNAVLRVYPNPTKDQLHYRLQDARTVEKVIVCDVNGRILLQEKTNNAGLLITEKLQPGIYVLQVVSDNNVYATTFVKQ